MIPKIIHYCWFGNSDIPDEHMRYIEGWKKLMPDYELRFWNESNSPTELPYMRTARMHGNWANMSNFVRLHVVFLHGGIYLDTDVEVLKRFDDLLDKKCFFGFESKEEEKRLVVNNAVFGAVPKSNFIGDCKAYLLANFTGEEPAHLSAPGLITTLLKNKGLAFYGNQNLDGVALFRADFFYPYKWTEDFSEDCLTSDTYAIHRWNKSWRAPYFAKRKKKEIRKARLSKLMPRPVAIWKDFGFAGLRLYRKKTVQLGPFRGMKFFTTRTRRSKLFAKLIGCYEEGLHELIWHLLDNNYEKIVIVGCRDGYYTTGLARLMPETNIIGYDVNEIALGFARSNAIANKVADRVSLHSVKYDSKLLMGEKFTGRTLLVLNSDSSEMDIFTEKTVSGLTHADILIQLNDFTDPGRKPRIMRLFEESHEFKLIPQRRLPTTVTHFLNNNNDTLRILNLIDEGKAERIEWLFLSSKKSPVSTL